MSFLFDCKFWRGCEHLSLPDLPVSEDLTPPWKRSPGKSMIKWKALSGALEIHVTTVLTQAPHGWYREKDTEQGNMPVSTLFGALVRRLSPRSSGRRLSLQQS